VRAIADTLARAGAVDSLQMGSNAFHNNGVALHEPWLAQLGLLIDDDRYDRAFARTLEHWRACALQPDGRLKSRWSGHRGDEMPGSYDERGFYECQWGWLMDVQPDFVLNAAENFDRTGDRAWLQRMKEPCERALDYLLKRDSDGDGLVEMKDDSCKEGRSSDWIDVVWAAHENGLVNAQMYAAMTRWSADESLLGDAAAAARYAQAAAKLKARYNQPVADGGLSDPDHSTYAYWREPDGSIHGTNGVVPVDFSAIGYGICDDPARRAAILDRIERRMQQEQLFFWPLCFDSFQPQECIGFEIPFPSYENGDLFLAWGELGVRCYAATDPEIALRYVRNVLARYAQDGLAFQRYLRKTQQGAGEDVLANNCSAIVGLYRDLYGVQPRWNRLQFDPHLPRELAGSRLVYDLRGTRFSLEPGAESSRAEANGLALRAPTPFGIAVAGRRLSCFHADDAEPVLVVEAPTGGALELDVVAGPRRFTEIAYGPIPRIVHTLHGLEPARRFEVRCAGAPLATTASDASGTLTFERAVPAAGRAELEIVPAPE
jgi:hypothetical protein